MKYLFIDTNIYKYFFNENTTFSDDVVSIIRKLIDGEKLILILPRQVTDEIKRNHLENWYISECEDKEKTKDVYVKNIGLKIDSLNEYPKLKKVLEKEKTKYFKKYDQDIKFIEEKYRNPKKSKAIRHLTELQKMAEVIETDNILDRAIIRDYKNNPPYDKTKITDAIIWESILGYFEKINKKSVLYFLSDDNCYGKKGFHPFLLDEISKFKVKVHYRKSVSSLRDLLGSDIDKITEQEKEEQKKNAIYKFINSRSWASAGSNFTELLKFKHNLTLEDYRDLIKASTINDQIYRSFYVNASELLEDINGKGFTLPVLDEIEDSAWKAFKDKNLILLNRRKDNVNIPQNDL